MKRAAKNTSAKVKPKNGKKSPLCSFNTDDFANNLNRHFISELESNGSIQVDPRPYDFFCQQTKNAVLKKFIPHSERDNPNRHNVAVAKFISVSNRIANINLELSTYVRDVIQTGSYRMAPKRDRRATALVRARNLTHQILGELDPASFFQACRHGPGTSIGVPYRDSGNSRKWALPLTATDSACGIFDLYRKWDSTLNDCLMRENPDLVLTGAHIYDIVTNSRLTTVSKTVETDRVIAIEPTVNMFLQQGLGRLIAKLLKSFGIDINHQQDLHKFMAFIASVTGLTATIDWSSASDCVVLELIRFLFPPSWLYVIERIRCEYIDVDGVLMPVNCVSSMGNATTFPIETLVFYVLAIAVDSLKDGSRSGFVEYESFTKRGISIFGDDCIVPVDIAEEFIELCNFCGFIVNEDKTFVKGPFKESCGSDYYSGRNVRPVYLQAPRSQKASCKRAWLYICWNKALKNAINAFGTLNYVYHSHTLKYVAQEMCRWNKEILLVPPTDPDDSGCKTFGDWKRLKRLFHGMPTAKITVDRHGTARYKSLISCSPPEGTNSDNLEYWYRMKFPPTLTATDDFSKPFMALKTDLGYVVKVGTDCTDFKNAL